MKNQIRCAALAALLAISTTKTALAQQWQWFGIGSVSCARWTISRVAELELKASTWIMGFWISSATYEVYSQFQSSEK
jgi:hypothetical protein